MGEYTRFLEERSYDYFPEKGEYEEELIKNAKMFRDFDEAMDDFIKEQGYTGDIGDIYEKNAFLTAAFKRAGISVPRNMKKWYTEHKRIERQTAFQICFAFSLDIEKADDFFRRVCLQRGFDLHMIPDIVFFFALSHGYRYAEAEKLIEKIEMIEKDRTERAETVYTSGIAEAIQMVHTPEGLVRFFEQNIGLFGYNNATAYRYIRMLWSEIAGTDGLAAREKKVLYQDFDGESEELPAKRADRKAGRGNVRKKDLAEKPDKAESMWKIYLQILGLSGNRISVLDTDRSIKPILKDSPILHPIAEFSFPDRDGLNKILNREHVSYDRVRKILILLAFYKFWVSRALKNGHYDSTGGDLQRCEIMINTYLLDAGYPLLYIGNPFDWLMLYSLVNSDFPLVSFREFMQELFYEKFQNV